MKVVRVHADSEGETHLEEVDMPEAVGAPATAYTFAKFPNGFDTGWHPSAKRWIVLYLSGEMEVEASDGTSHRFRAGDVTLADDTTGKGHRSQVVGDAAAVMVLIEVG